ncbi:MAG: OsmC family peroxiredoxin [Vulcanococcus sp.]
MTESQSSAIWNGNLIEGGGTMRLGKSGYEGPFTKASRFESGDGTNPEELIGAAHAGCFSMFLSAILCESGFSPLKIHTTARVHLGDGPAITRIELETEGIIPNCSEHVFRDHAEKAKSECPVSKALATVPMTLSARLLA